MGGLLVSLLVAMSIQTAGTCPTVADVERQLAPLLPSGFPSSTSDVAAIEENADGSLTLSFARFDVGTITHRRLPRARTCADQAETVAVTLATWEARIHPEISLRLDRLSPAGSSAEPQPAPLASVTNRDPLLVRKDDGARASGSSIALGAGLAGAWQPGSVAPGGRVDLALNRVDSPWRGRLSLAGVGQHMTNLGPGQASWWRLYLALGADYSISLGSHWAVVAGAAAALGVVRVAGSGFSVNQSTWSTDVGVEVLARIEWRRSRFKPWLGLATVAWLRAQRLELIGAETSRVLPRAEPMVAMGATFLGGP